MNDSLTTTPPINKHCWRKFDLAQQNMLYCVKQVVRPSQRSKQFKRGRKWGRAMLRWMDKLL